MKNAEFSLVRSLQKKHDEEKIKNFRLRGILNSFKLMGNVCKICSTFSGTKYFQILLQAIINLIAQVMP